MPVHAVLVVQQELLCPCLRKASVPAFPMLLLLPPPGLRPLLRDARIVAVVLLTLRVGLLIGPAAAGLDRVFLGCRRRLVAAALVTRLVRRVSRLVPQGFLRTWYLALVLMATLLGAQMSRRIMSIAFFRCRARVL